MIPMKYTNLENRSKWQTIDFTVPIEKFNDSNRCYGLQRSGDKAECTSGDCYIFDNHSPEPEKRVPGDRWTRIYHGTDMYLYLVAHDKCTITREQLDKKRAYDKAAQEARKNATEKIAGDVTEGVTGDAAETAAETKTDLS
jgi:hypothetical protein